MVESIVVLEGVTELNVIFVNFAFQIEKNRSKLRSHNLKG